jgi:hypothetical protein
MENSNSLDIVLGILALLIVIGGLFMLYQGIASMDSKD